MIWYVDDDPVNARILRRLLRAISPDLDMQTFTSGRQALELAKQDSPPPAMILLDLHLPDMTGLDLAHRLHALYPHTPLALLSALPLADLQDAAGSHHPFSHLLSKPLTLAALRSLLDSSTIVPPARN